MKARTMVRLGTQVKADQTTTPRPGLPAGLLPDLLYGAKVPVCSPNPTEPCAQSTSTLVVKWGGVAAQVAPPVSSTSTVPRNAVSKWAKSSRITHAVGAVGAAGAAQAPPVVETGL